MDDVESVAELVATCDIAEFGEPDYDLEDLRADWQLPEIALDTDVWVVLAPKEQLAGYGLMYNRENVRLYADVYVHPEYLGRGIGTYLAHKAERWAGQQVPKAPPGVRVTLFNSISSVNEAGHRLLKGEGYTLARHFWRMQIDMKQEPAAVTWPDGLAIRTFVPGQDDRATFDAMEEAFRDHWGYLPWRFDSWEQSMIKRNGFDPGLWFLAMDGDEIAGGSLCHYYPHEGWVDQLGVRRPWRRRGLGLALLRHSFREFYRRAQRRVALGVDSQSETGATRLYQQAGMRIVRQYDSYQKVLRPGEEPNPETGEG
jgi:mycothiol synthase